MSTLGIMKKIYVMDVILTVPLQNAHSILYCHILRSEEQSIAGLAYNKKRVSLLKRKLC